MKDLKKIERRSPESEAVGRVDIIQTSELEFKVGIEKPGRPESESGVGVE